jgi:hypothetical protein
MKTKTNSDGEPLVNGICPTWKSHEWCHEHDTWHDCKKCGLIVDDQEDYVLLEQREALHALVYERGLTMEKLKTLVELGGTIRRARRATASKQSGRNFRDSRRHVSVAWRSCAS